MIILVKVNQTYKPGMDPKLVAYSSWECGRLLDDTIFRNKYKYLVAYYHGQIVGTFCIHGVSLDLPNSGNRRKVKFLLENTDDKCEQHIKNNIQPLIDNKYPKIFKAMSFCYLNINDLSQSKEYIEGHNCNCSIENIPVLESEEILVDDSPNKEINPLKTPSNLWFKLTIIRHTWDSFGQPNIRNIKIVIIYNPNGSVKYVKSDDSSGSLLTSSISLKSNQLREIKRVISIFHQDPTYAIKNIENSGIENHIVHSNHFKVEFEAFSDAKLINRVQQAEWEGNVLHATSGFLKLIYDIIF